MNRQSVHTNQVFLRLDASNNQLGKFLTIINENKNIEMKRRNT